ncbi:major facilitator superfamily domain-containing protein [Desarmillaria tabescens]|uniref:Major facilitator superfamily domain-containing protein n=1 Tax=Armillaria tabescens TaxID=1929756 RepID=A0AA39NJE7_ARMTA|nr:major facilitator superfamily domain-containing protein [Desarmillaria tabescens]KAK0466762.1 major facilitator superfamily domain-containing protein [Desarmillaria tabescens]
MVQDILRDSTIGQVINYISSGRIFPYADQRPDFEVPSHFLLPSQRPSTIVSPDSDATTLCGDLEKSRGASTPGVQLTRESTLAVGIDTEKQKQIDIALSSDPYTVGWYGDDDQENPRNWSPAKRAFVAFSISFLTFSVYIGSAIYTPSIPGLMADFNVSQTMATLGLTLYILAYGIGPMFLAPLQELPGIGRNPVYMATLFLFVIFQIPVAVARNMSTVLAFRFLTGFVGSPALATGGASMADIYPKHQFPYVLGIWALGSVAGPITGPVIGGFAAQANGWRWPQYELIWIAGFALIFLLLLLPETYEPTILLKRAQRLRKLTGNQELRSQSEKDKGGESLGEVMQDALIRPFILAKEPVLMFANVYLGFVYAIFYLWFEAFPLVFVDIYHFNLGVSGLPFLGFVVSGAITKYHIAPRFAKAEAAGVDIAPEIRLEIGLIASIFIPTSVLIFGFTSKESIHWIAPIIGAALYLPGIYLTFQSILTYITSAYPTYAASVLAGNDLFRSAIASVFPLFGRAFFVNLGLGPASALLAGVSFLMMPVFWSLWKWGHVLRRRSVYAASP